ncbi:hypothetical protein DNTS_035502 [Danionella cerebrum]|uniref:Large ribosomal subunit protein mL54 n=1 Tax=Danionella cerebrum TaxID=2873325 RepID=A0A553RG79_9TELE|nr:hypothetical protein DNTS_035502 [Danionella translucida]
MANSILRFFCIRTVAVLNTYNNIFVNSRLIQCRSYAKKPVAKGKGKGKGVAKEDLKGPEVCKDPVKLCTYAVGVNIFKEGEDPPIKNKEDYPEWLYQLNLGPAKTLSEMEPDTLEYIKRSRKMHIWRQNKLRKGKRV